MAHLKIKTTYNVNCNTKYKSTDVIMATFYDDFFMNRCPKLKILKMI